MKKRLFSSVIICCWLNTALCQQNPSGYWQQRVDYLLDVQLNDTVHTLDGNASITYYNQSPDTLSYLWIHLWPNAYKNDKTAFSEQLLLEGSTRFYFSRPDQKGYINRLDFRADGEAAIMEDHPVHLDIVKLLLPRPLLPGKSVNITTPFHVQLPDLFSRSGHSKGFYAVAQWFPKVAVYDNQGWHPMPYLSCGEFYANFGNYDVSITLPEAYTVASTGVLLDEEEKKRMLASANRPAETKKTTVSKGGIPKKSTQAGQPHTRTSMSLKTLRFKAEQVIDFAWSAAKYFQIKYDTCQLEGKSVEVWNFCHPDDVKTWKNSMMFSKRALRFYSEKLGTYPYPQLSVAASPASEADGMEYPMFTMLNVKAVDEKLLDIIIAHETGHNWLQAVIATNERQYAWMDEGMNTYFEQQYEKRYYPSTVSKKGLEKKWPDNEGKLAVDWLTSTRRDVPIASHPEKVKPAVFYPVIYQKAAEWMNVLENKLGPSSMQDLMQTYFRQWKFRHPDPIDFKRTAEQVAGQQLDQVFDLLQRKGPLLNQPPAKTAFTGLFNFSGNGAKKFLSIAPATGYNQYDRWQAGILLHNYNIPVLPLQWVAIPMISAGTRKPVGFGSIQYSWYPESKVRKTTAFASLARFHVKEAEGPDQQKLTAGYTKFTPGIKLEFKEAFPLSTVTSGLELKTFIIREEQFDYRLSEPPALPGFYAVPGQPETRIIPQATYYRQNNRKLYPWSMEAAVQQVSQLIRFSWTGKYFLNYRTSDKGVSIRMFAGKIFYTTEKNNASRFANRRYHFTMHAPNGWQDYTYSAPFMERNQSATLAGRQVLIRDGGFKYRSDFSSVVPGLPAVGADYFDDWLASVNLEIDIPDNYNPLSVLPVKMPLKIFADFGTSASPWRPGSTQPRFLYSIGLQLPLLKCIQIYYPLLQSSAFKDPNNVNDPSRPGGPAWWQKKLTFSINLNALKPAAEGYSLF